MKYCMAAGTLGALGDPKAPGLQGPLDAKRGPRVPGLQGLPQSPRAAGIHRGLSENPEPWG